MFKQDEFTDEEKLELVYNFFKNRAAFYLELMMKNPMDDVDYSYDYQLDYLKEFENCIFECEKYRYDIEKTLELFDVRRSEILISK
jgi:hypothetical protein